MFTLQRMAETACSTWGLMTCRDSLHSWKILERGAHNPDHPRIPAGTYTVIRKPFGTSEFDVKFREYFGLVYQGILWLPRVPGRSNIEIHTANYIEQLRGCLATGLTIDKDAHGDFMIKGGTSIPAYKTFYSAITEDMGLAGVELTIKDIQEGMV